MFYRRKQNKSGSVSVQIIEKRAGRNVVVETVGCAQEEREVSRLEARARTRIGELSPQLRFEFSSSTEQAAIELLKTVEFKLVGPELIIGRIFDKIGFSVIPEKMFKDLVVARLAYPASKLRTSEYLLQYQGRSVDVDQIYRFLDRLNDRHKYDVEQIAYSYSKQILGNELTIVFYDMTTLYFEAEHEDDLRKIGFSKDGKFQKPQIMIGLLVGKDGYPVSYDIFEGNTFEGKTLLPVIEKAQRRFGFSKPTIVADSGLLSNHNVQLLIQQKYHFILGARIKTEARSTQQQILKSAHQLQDGQSLVLEKPGGLRLIVNYSAKRARKDAHNREKGLQRLKAKVGAGRLSKKHINNRGYNKFLVLKGNVSIELDQEKIQQDKKWDGLKGYLTNSDLPIEAVIANYRQLWKIEKAFRISKTDLRIRPIFHRKKNRIEAHICIAFVAYTVFKELERLINKYDLDISPQKAIELTKTIFQFQLYLPDSKKIHRELSKLDNIQKKLLEISRLG